MDSTVWSAADLAVSLSQVPNVRCVRSNQIRRGGESGELDQEQQPCWPAAESSSRVAAGLLGQCGESCLWSGHWWGMPHTHIHTLVGRSTLAQLNRPLTCFSAQSRDKQAEATHTANDAASGFKPAGLPLLNLPTTNLNVQCRDKLTQIQF